MSGIDLEEPKCCKDLATAGPKLLVVTFASAPGVPNWGGVLSRLAREASPEEKCFDIFFVCDGGRNWYSGVQPPNLHCVLCCAVQVCQLVAKPCGIAELAAFANLRLICCGDERKLHFLRRWR